MQNFFPWFFGIFGRKCWNKISDLLCCKKSTRKIWKIDFGEYCELHQTFAGGNKVHRGHPKKNLKNFQNHPENFLRSWTWFSTMVMEIIDFSTRELWRKKSCAKENEFGVEIFVRFERSWYVKVRVSRILAENKYSRF